MSIEELAIAWRRAHKAFHEQAQKDPVIDDNRKVSSETMARYLVMVDAEDSLRAACDAEIALDDAADAEIGKAAE